MRCEQNEMNFSRILSVVLRSAPSRKLRFGIILPGAALALRGLGGFVGHYCWTILTTSGSYMLSSYTAS